MRKPSPESDRQGLPYRAEPFCIHQNVMHAMNGSQDKRQEQVAAYVDPQTKARIQAAAGREGRSVSSYVAQLLKRQMDVENRVYGDSTRSETAAAS